jgi:hypothetical protein
LGSFSIALAAVISFKTAALYGLEQKFEQIFYIKFKKDIQSNIRTFD